MVSNSLENANQLFDRLMKVEKKARNNDFNLSEFKSQIITHVQKLDSEIDVFRSDSHIEE